MDVDVIMAILTAMAAAFAAWAAWEAKKAVKITQDTAEAGLICDFLDQYFQPEMANALRTLRRWRDMHGIGFAKKWIDELQMPTSEPTAQDVELARRHVKGYFFKAGALGLRNIITPETFRMIASTSGWSLYDEIGTELEKALDAKGIGDVPEIRYIRSQIGERDRPEVKSVPPRR